MTFAELRAFFLQNVRLHPVLFLTKLFSVFFYFLLFLGLLSLQIKALLSLLAFTSETFLVEIRGAFFVVKSELTGTNQNLNSRTKWGFISVDGERLI